MKHPATAAKAYRLLSSILKTAVSDGVITANPCRVRGAGVERSPERPVARLDDVEALARAMPERLRVVVLLAAWCQLRRGEILALRRSDIDVVNETVIITKSRTFTMGGSSIEKEPKTAAGVREIAVPSQVMRALGTHLEKFVDENPDSYLLTDAAGQPLSANSLHGHWRRARQKVGCLELRFHDLRHFGLTMAAGTGATVAELMHRAGHTSFAAAQRYQHASRDRDRTLARALDAVLGVDDTSAR
ncbi:MAG: site-specific integrase [Acidobacteriota bacterium]|nr:site-specific integrase [Acidobacteriota bacterium]